MPALPPQYLLFTETRQQAAGRLWRFLLVPAGDAQPVTATDIEPNLRASRAELLALVRGLEAIDQPGHVKLVASSNYVTRGISRGLNQWKRQGWHWERFGRRVPVRDCDLWQRVDRAMEFHSLDCVTWSRDAAEFDTEAGGESPRTELMAEPAVIVVPKRQKRRPMSSRAKRAVGRWKQQLGGMLQPELAPAG